MNIVNDNTVMLDADTKEKLLQNERMLFTLLGNLPGMAYRCRNDEHWTMEFASAGCFDLTGYEPDDFIENKRISFANLIHKEDRQRVWTITQTALLQKQPFRLTYRIITAAGKQKWVWEQGVGIFSPDGTIEALEGFITDITHRKHAEKQVRDSEARFRRIFEDSSFGIAMCGDDFRFITTNNAFCQMTGYSEQELTSLTFRDITHPDDRAASTELVLKLLNKQIPNYRIEKRYLRKNGTILWASITVSAIRDEKGDFLYFLGMIEDITEHKQAENALRESEASIRSIFTAVPVGMGLVVNRIIVKANARLCEMTGYSQEELLGHSAKMLYPTEEDFQYVGQEKYKQIAERGTGTVETRWKRKDGTVIDILLSSAPLDSGNLSAGVTFTATDITERKQNEIELTRLNEELKKQDKLKNEFVSTVSHELRTPLCIFKNILSNAMAGVLGPISPKLRRNLETANQTIDRLVRIVNDFLDIARIEGGKTGLCLKRVAVQSIIREVIETFTPVTTSKNIRLDSVMPQEETGIEGDRDKLVQVLINLVGNAIKCTQAGGHLLITLSDCTDQISISVHDDGPGIEAKYLDKIFNRFEMGATSLRAGQPSTGLGLTISKELVEMHHGKIWVESVVGQGSTFTFTLPKKQPAKN